MISCPKCGRPVGGRARSCGYCGASLVGDYFGGQKAGEPRERRPAGPGAVAATTLGVFGCAALLGALACQLLALFGFSPQAPLLGLSWWLRALPLILLPIILLVQLLMLGGHRKSVWLDAFWLFLSACGLSVTIQAYLGGGASGFYGLLALPYLLVVGCALVAVSSIVSLLFSRPD